MQIIRAVSLLFMFSLTAFAQSRADTCHVYVVDIAKSKQAIENLGTTGNEEADEKALRAGQTLFPAFNPTIGEEELTTKHYQFPNSKLVITASVYYTDESMASHPHGEFAAHSESMLIGVTVANKAKQSAIGPGDEGAIAEVTYDQFTNIVRVKKYVTVRGRSYLLGIECDCMSEKQKK